MLRVKKVLATGVLAVGDTVTGATADGEVTAVFSNEASFKRILKNFTGTYTTGEAELLSKDMREIGFTIARKSVEAKSRALKGQYSVEMYQDLEITAWFVG